MENERQTPVLSISPQIYAANMELMSNPLFLLPNLLLMPFYLFAQLLSGLFGTYYIQKPTATLIVQPYQLPLTYPQSLPPVKTSEEESTPSPSSQLPSSAPVLASTPRIIYTNTEEWELKRDKSGRLKAIIIHRKATEESEATNV